MHFGIFVEEMRQGSSQTSAFRDIFELAERAEAWGLITQVVPDDGLDAAVQALAGELAARAPLALRTLKMVLNRGADAPLETALELERKAYAWLRSTHDYEEGVRSFLEKRTPDYRGR